MNRIMKRMCLVIAVCVCDVSVAAGSALELHGDPDELRTFLHPAGNVVRIDGRSAKKAYADKAIVSLLIVTEDQRLSRAIAANGDVRGRVARTLTAAGIDAEAIKNSKFATLPQYGWFRSDPTSYRVLNRMAIGIVKEEHLQEIAAVADAHKEVELSDLSFEHTRKDAFTHQVRMEALNNIIQQKTFYENALGVILTPVRFGDGATRLHPTAGAMMRFSRSERRRADSVVEDREAFMLSAESDDDVLDTSFDEIDYEAALAVYFKIEESARAPACLSSEC